MVEFHEAGVFLEILRELTRIVFFFFPFFKRMSGTRKESTAIMKKDIFDERQ